jgi:hypothetical protein
MFAPLTLACALALLVALPSRAAAQQRADTAGAADLRAQAQVMARLAVLTRPEVAEQLAIFTRNYFDALLHKGFSRDEALRIVAATGDFVALGSR